MSQNITGTLDSDTYYVRVEYHPMFKASQSTFCEMNTIINNQEKKKQWFTLAIHEQLVDRKNHKQQRFLPDQINNQIIQRVPLPVLWNNFLSLDYANNKLFAIHI